jgi:hypothetical protein
LAIAMTGAHGVAHQTKDKPTKKEWSEVVCLGKARPSASQREIGRQVIDACTVEQLKAWVDDYDLELNRGSDD